MREFTIERDYNGMGCNIYKKRKIAINTGVTVLVGCNGIGKTTLITQMLNHLKREKIPARSFNNLTDGGSHARSKAAYYQDFAFVGASMSSSEGENITLNLGVFAREIGRFIKENKDATEMWFFFDAIDSGLSVDNIVDVKEYMFKTIFRTAPNTDIYIVVTANEYEFARGEECFDVYRGKYVRFSTYERYRNFILKTREEKDKRVYKE